jgi:quinol monooxygenase YgiN
MDNSSPDRSATTLVNMLACEPTDQETLLALLRENTERVVSSLDGWISTTLVAAADGSRVVIVSQWRDPSAVKAMQSDPRMRAWLPRIAALAQFDSVMGHVAHACSARVVS